MEDMDGLLTADARAQGYRGVGALVHLGYTGMVSC